MSRINVAVVGLGFMGVTHLKGWRNVPGARVSAVVDADARRLTGDLSSVGGNLSSVGGNLGGGGEKFDFSDFRNQHVRGYQSLTEALADRAIDAVDICLPTDQHATAATAALRAGKHVLTEKPLALDVPAAETLVRESEASGKILMAAHVVRFFPAYEKLTECVRAGGAVRSAFFRRRCAAPTWSPWLMDPLKSGGAALDLLIHDADYCISVFGMPQAVRARGYRDLPRGIDVIHADLIYSSQGPVIVSGGWHHPNSYPFSMEFTVTTDAATFDWSSVSNDFRSHGEDGEGRSLSLEEKDAFTAELAYFAGCAANNRQPERCPPAQSVQAVALVEKMVESRKRNGATV